MNPYLQFVTDLARLTDQAKTFPLGAFAPAPRPALSANAQSALFFAPHPDDECISGGIALRMLREAGMRLVNVAVTQGSNKARQAARFEELKAACDYLGFDLAATGPNGLEKVSPKTRQQDAAQWAASVNVIARILQEHKPKVIVFPHERDWNSTHIGTHYLIMDALKQIGPGYECYLVESEFWGQMDDPNLMVELGEQDLADMVTATSFHVGEVQRNPYHLSLPAWTMDNVRRGGELVGGQGGAAPDFKFAALYRLRRWTNGQALRFYEGGKQVARTTNIGTLFA